VSAEARDYIKPIGAPKSKDRSDRYYCKTHIDSLLKRQRHLEVLEKLPSGCYVEYPRQVSGYGGLPTLSELEAAYREGKKAIVVKRSQGE
jgi:hypothetical protein